MKSRVLKEGKYYQANNHNPIVIDLERMYANADCCAKCYYLRFIRVNSKEHFFCKYKDREITHDNTSHCKDFVAINEVREFLKQITKYYDSFYDSVWKKHKHKELDEQSKKDLKLLYNMANKYGRNI